MTVIQSLEGEYEPGNYFERPKIFGIQNIARDIAQRLYMRHRLGGAEYVVAGKPGELLALVEKRWRRMMHQILVKRAATNDSDTEKLIEFSRQIAYMQTLQFTENPLDEPEARVVMVTPDAAAAFPPACSTMYIIAVVDEKMTHRITSQMPYPRSLIKYEISIIE